MEQADAIVVRGRTKGRFLVWFLFGSRKSWWNCYFIDLHYWSELLLKKCCIIFLTFQKRLHFSTLLGRGGRIPNSGRGLQNNQLSLLESKLRVRSHLEVQWLARLCRQGRPWQEFDSAGRQRRHRWRLPRLQGPWERPRKAEVSSIHIHVLSKIASLNGLPSCHRF